MFCLAAAMALASVGCGWDSTAQAATAVTGRTTEAQKAAITPLTVPAGTALAVRLNHTVGTDRNRAGDRFSGVVIAPVKVGEGVAVPKGALVSGVLRDAAPSGRLKGRAVLRLALDQVEWSGRSYHLDTGAVTRVSGGHKKRNWSLIGGGSGVGAMIGGIASGGAGALIGAGAGAAAGTAGAAFTGRKQVRIPAETVLTFRLREPLTVPRRVPEIIKEKS
jgi:hypothetical protein